MSELNHISLYGFKTEDDLDNNIEQHIDSIVEDDNWIKDVNAIVASNKPKFFHISVQSDDGRRLPEFP
jgi:hypothetical protein